MQHKYSPVRFILWWGIIKSLELIFGLYGLTLETIIMADVGYGRKRRRRASSTPSLNREWATSEPSMTPASYTTAYFSSSTSSASTMSGMTEHVAFAATGPSDPREMNYQWSMRSPSISPVSPIYPAASPRLSRSSPIYSPPSPLYSPTSPVYSLTSPTSSSTLSVPSTRLLSCAPSHTHNTTPPRLVKRTSPVKTTTGSQYGDTANHQVSSSNNGDLNHSEHDGLGRFSVQIDLLQHKIVACDESLLQKKVGVCYVHNSDCFVIDSVCDVYRMSSLCSSVQRVPACWSLALSAATSETNARKQRNKCSCLPLRWESCDVFCHRSMRLWL